MKKIRVLVSMIIVSLCIQGLSMTSAFADTDMIETQWMTETQTATDMDTAIIQVQQVELDLLQEGSTNPESYGVTTVSTTQKAIPKSELKTKATAAGVSLKSHIASQMDAYKEKIDVSGFGLTYTTEANRVAVLNKTFKAITDTINNNPRLFFVGNTLKVGYSAAKNGKILSIYPEYTMSQSKANTVKKSFDAAVKKAVGTVKKSMSAVQKAKAIHNYIALNAEYDYKNYNKNTVPIDSFRANGVLVNKVGVCQSYAMAYKYIMENKLGIKCGYASTSAHIWNQIKVGSKYYNVDVTWDDGGKKKVNYKYFLVGKTTMAKAHKKQKIKYGFTSAASDYGTPGKVTAKSVKAAKKAATLTWVKKSGATGYQVYVSLKKTKNFKNAKTIGKNSTVKFTKKSLKKGRTYFFKVRAYKKINGKKVYGSFSSVKFAKIK